jgi:beta-glucosidase
MKNLTLSLALLMLILFNSCGPKWTEVSKGNFKLVINEDGRTLGYSQQSGVKILTVNRLAFKDLNRNGELDPYEDWRLSPDERSADLASKMSVEEIAGLMLYSSHQAIPSGGGGFMRGGTYGGQPFDKSGAKPSDLSDQQKKFLTEDHLRHVLITTVATPEVAAEWNNNAQALVEGLGSGIPVNTSSDPRHGVESYAEFNAGAGGKISMWPTTLGIAATFNPEIMKKFGEIASAEYRALGIATALSPQIDLATEPRWSRYSGTMGEDPDLATDMARAYVDGFQTSADSFEIAGGWGYRSVNAMVKHWPGGGPEEGGRDGHFGYGAYAVYPGNNLADHLKPFTEGAFKLSGPTGMASAVMPYYTISYNIDKVNGENVGNAYNKYLITDLLRKEYGFEGVVCTDWGVTGDVTSVDQFEGKSWGVEKLSVAERHYKVLMAGCDQFGGNNDKGPVIEAYNIGVKELGKETMRKRFEESAVRLLMNIFRTGLFENPYLDPEVTRALVGNPEFMKAGYVTQVASVVMLKNHLSTLPVQTNLKVYIPKRFTAAGRNWFGQVTPEKWSDAVNLSIAGKYFTVVEDPKDADIAFLFISSPQAATGYDREDIKKGGNGYVPIPLQYGRYTADSARETSLAGGSPFEDFTNRTYRGKSWTVVNSYDMKMVKETHAKMGVKPVIVVVNTSNPFVPAEIEKEADAILLHFGVQDQALMDMNTVEEQLEDVPRDMKCYVDSDGNSWDFAFGLNWKGVISDERVTKYNN